MEVEKKITIIPAKTKLASFNAAPAESKKKVAAYARVSTDSDEQFTSFQAQIEYYTNYVNTHIGWELVKVYADEGISGTNTKKRVGFNEMIQDALDGKFSLIITKSVSRFARNTVDSLSTIRKLKDAGVEVYFEKENIHTFDSTGELLITIMSSLAQEESRSISENVTWGQRQSFKNGKVHLSYSNFLGYEKGPDGRPKVVEGEANIIRFIYHMYIYGYSCSEIARKLEERKIKSPSGTDKWRVNVITSILTNEKYKGDALLQKNVTTNFLTHKCKKNEGEAPQYYVTGSHEPIIIPEEWDLVQTEVERRKTIGQAYNTKSQFLCKIFCGDCGGLIGQKIWHSNEPRRCIRYVCNDKYKHKPNCKTPSLTKEQIQKAFVEACNRLAKDKNTVVRDANLILDELKDDTLMSQLEEVKKELISVKELADSLVNSYALNATSKESYEKEYEKLTKRFDSLSKKETQLSEQIKRKGLQRSRIESFIGGYEKNSTLFEEWSQEKWALLLQKAIVYRDNTIRFIFYTGLEYLIKIK